MGMDTEISECGTGGGINIAAIIVIASVVVTTAVVVVTAVRVIMWLF